MNTKVEKKIRLPGKVFYNYNEKACIIQVGHFFYQCYYINFISAPVFMPSPSVFPLSPYSLNVSWEKPEDNLARGEVTGYSVNLMTEQRFLPPFSQVFFLVTLSFS